MPEWGCYHPCKHVAGKWDGSRFDGSAIQIASKYTSCCPVAKRVLLTGGRLIILWHLLLLACSGLHQCLLVSCLLIKVPSNYILSNHQVGLVQHSCEPLCCGISDQFGVLICALMFLDRWWVMSGLLDHVPFEWTYNQPWILILYFDWGNLWTKQSTLTSLGNQQVTGILQTWEQRTLQAHLYTSYKCILWN